MIDLVQKRVFKTKYHILPGKPNPDSPYLDLYNRSYNYWKEFWNDVFAGNGCPGDLCNEDFPRQDFFGLITYEGHVVAMQLYCKFDLEQAPTLDHPYMVRSFNQEYMDHLREKKTRTLMSMEYLTIHPEWRKRQIGLSLGNVLIGLVRKIQIDNQIDALVAPSRADVKVNELVNNNGGISIVKNIMQHNTPVDLNAIFLDATHETLDDLTKELIQHHWENRIDHANATTNSHQRREAA